MQNIGRGYNYLYETTIIFNEKSIDNIFNGYYNLIHSKPIIILGNKLEGDNVMKKTVNRLDKICMMCCCQSVCINTVYFSYALCT